MIELWRDVSDTITYTPPFTDFDLGGIVGAPDARYLLATQGTTGQLSRIDIATKAIIEVAVEGLPLVNADGIVLRGHHVYVVQNFGRQINQTAPAVGGCQLFCVSSPEGECADDECQIGAAAGGGADSGVVEPVW